MLIGAVEYVLILVTLLAGVVGTVSNPSGRVKVLIISLAIVTSLGTVIKTLEAARKDRINEKLVVTLVQSSNPPEYFSHDLVKFINRILEKSGQLVSGQTVFEDRGERILTLANSADKTEISGILFFSRKQMNPIYYEYAIDGDLTTPLSTHLNQSWSDCTDHWDACFAELSAIGKLAMEIAPVEVAETTPELTEDLLFSLISSETYHGEPIRIELDKEFIESLYQLPPGKRGVEILMAGQQKIIGQI